ncbi:MAG: RpiB/LacA/LacB family sugar-phosphate isomerase, partial [Aigarchaeota archaeon]|nr:RpiB/LacA/LacB family sugar-phosphate isomerase [Aigarchaeota archaeon]
MRGRRVAVGADDLYPAAKAVVEHLRSKGYEVIELGSLRTGKVEPWPDVGTRVGEMVVKGEVD